MKVELLGSLNYSKLSEVLKSEGIDEVKVDTLIGKIKYLEKEARIRNVSLAGRLSRFPGDVFEVLGLSEEKSLDSNLKYINRVVNMGHESITDHDYCLFLLKDVSPLIEQTIIEERLSSFTIKSRREVDFSNAGFYTPIFYDKAGNVIKNNGEVQREYQEYTESLFKKYSEFINKGISKEDARFILPYSFNSNIIMGMDAHTLKNLIIKLTKTKYSKISELKELGERLNSICEEHIPYVSSSVSKVECDTTDKVDELLKGKFSKNYRVIKQPVLIGRTYDVDNKIIASAIMRRYQFNYIKALNIAKNLDDEIRKEIVRRIAFESDGLELSQVSFEYQIPISFAVLTHLTRHRMHDIITPDFSPVVDLKQYKIPPKIQNVCLDGYLKVYEDNYRMYKHFKDDYGIRDEDLVYFTLSGNMVNVQTNINGKNLKHILALRECNKAQWEIREVARGMHEEIKKLDDAKLFETLLGPSCETELVCREGKESCGKINAILVKKK